jgi:dephospho-CoA kinase
MQKILDAQEKYATSMALADEVISNNTTIEELYTKLDEMMEKLDLVEISSQRRK